jgi:hypothetical protein
VLPVERLRDRALERPLLRRDRLLLDRLLLPLLRDRLLDRLERLLLDFLVAISCFLLS